MVFIYDYETIANCFIAYFEENDSDYGYTFEISPWKNDYLEMYSFLKVSVEQRDIHLGFNNLAFDAQISQYLLDRYEFYREMSGADLAAQIYKDAQYVISKTNKGGFAPIPPWRISIRQLDVYKIMHWDSNAKRTSLKAAQYAIDWPNLQDMPLPHNKPVKKEDVPMIIEYCINDVRSTKAVKEKTKKQIKIRGTLSKQYQIDLYNASEPSISKKLFLKFLSSELGVDSKVLSKQRTYRNQIALKDVFLDYYQFTVPEIQKAYDVFQTKVVPGDNLKGVLKYEFSFDNIDVALGTGGIHGATKTGVYESDNDWMIMSDDVTSYYPNLAIRNGFYPAHLPKDQFLNLYEGLFDKRRTIPKSNPINYLFKIILNSTYGLSNDENSYLYDPMFTLQITVNGQFSLLLFYDMIKQAIPNVKPLMFNTDGLEVMIPRDQEETYMKVREEWQKLVSLELEMERYAKLILPDVNNYIALKEFSKVVKEVYGDIKKTNSEFLFKEEDGSYYYAGTKCKGRFEFKDLEDYAATHLHKNKSFLIVSKAIYNYFIHDILPEDTIRECKDIFQFCGRLRAKGEWYFVNRSFRGSKLIDVPLQKTIRYYVGKRGGKIMKLCNDGRESQVHADKSKQVIYNRHIPELPWHKYGIDEAFYINKVYSEINTILNSYRGSFQTTLNF